MAGYRGKFIKSLHFFGSAVPIEWLIRLTGQKLIVPVYHLISDEPVDHIRHLYPVKKLDAFIKDLDFLLKHYSPIDYHTFRDLITERKKPEKNSFLLTFDDGLREFHDVIAPILLHKGIPAICFLNSDFIDNKSLFYRYKVSLLINELSKNEKLLEGEKVMEWLNFYSESKAKNLQETLLSINYQNQQSLDQLAQIIHLDFHQYLREKQPYLTAPQIVSLRDKGFFFGGHSCDHPDYRFLNLGEQIRQTRESVEKVANLFSLPYKTFAFPFTDYGVSKEFFQTILEKAQVVDLSFGCAGLKSDSFQRHIQRIPLEMSGLSAKEILNSEYLYFLFKSVLGKNKILRK